MKQYASLLHIPICSLLIGLLTSALLADLPDRSFERPGKGKETMRIISYNILSGFANRTDRSRINRMVEWLNKADPDVLALEELNGFSSANLREYAKRWGHPYSAILKERSGCPVGITSKYPIEVKGKIVKGYWHGLLHVQIKGFDFLITHLDPRGWRYRLREANKIVEYAETIKNDKILLMGDFNSLSPLDADYTDENATGLRLRYAPSANLVDGKDIDFSVISRFLSFPFFDLCYQSAAKENRMTFPAKIMLHLPKSPGAHRRIGERIDFIFGTLAIRRITAQGYIINGEETAYLSDHYPVGVDLIF